MKIKVFYINLDFREDRNKEIIKELEKYPFLDYERFPAIYEKKRECLGCTKSHIGILKKILSNQNKNENKNENENENYIILEDDFSFHPSINIEEFFNKIKENNIDYNVILLSSNTIKSESSSFDFLKVAKEVQSTAGYMVKSHYIPILLKNMEDGLLALEENFRKNEPPYACIDQYWKILQSNKWFISEPRLGYQRASYSDIGQQYVDPQMRY